MFKNLFGKTAAIPPDKPVILELARRVLSGQISLDEAKKDVTKEENLNRITHLTPMAISDRFRRTKHSPDHNERLFNFYCAFLLWVVVDEVARDFKENCANILGESILVLPSPSPQLVEFGIATLKVAEGLALQREDTEMAGRICVNAAIGLMGLAQNTSLSANDRSLWIEAAIMELDTALDFVRETKDATVMGKVLVLTAMAYKQRINGNRKANVQKEVEFLTQAQTRFSPQSDPAQWADLQRQLQEARQQLSTL